MKKCCKCEKEVPDSQLKKIEIGNRWWYQYKSLPIYNMTMFFCPECYKKKILGNIIGSVVFLAILWIIGSLIRSYLNG